MCYLLYFCIIQFSILTYTVDKGGRHRFLCVDITLAWLTPGKLHPHGQDKNLTRMYKWAPLLTSIESVSLQVLWALLTRHPLTQYPAIISNIKMLCYYPLAKFFFPWQDVLVICLLVNFFNEKTIKSPGSNGLISSTFSHVSRLKWKATCNENIYFYWNMLPFSSVHLQFPLWLANYSPSH